ncbi:hypothetical protein Aazo_2697 ['Nostoc azollae' 0708]|uniref:Uncharacterized protein n=1 Tax=Nostoc azollae (strain 0708) TaxID=551115 RepID=D7DZT9_NOSA0|nr:hypothetical protein Aazo_2697 ['Nostoc azollae' 0708]
MYRKNWQTGYLNSYKIAVFLITGRFTLDDRVSVSILAIFLELTWYSSLILSSFKSGILNFCSQQLYYKLDIKHPEFNLVTNDLPLSLNQSHQSLTSQ